MNNIQKTLILGGLGAVIIILSYLVALTEIVPQLEIPAVVVPMATIEKKVIAENNELAVEEEEYPNSSVAKIKKEIVACSEAATTPLTYIAPLPFVDLMKAEMTGNLTVKGIDELGFCHIDQEITKTMVFMTMGDRETMMLNQGITASEVDKAIGEMNEEYAQVPVVTSDCYGTGENLLAYFQALENGQDIGEIKVDFSTEEGSINTMADYQVTCITPVIVFEKSAEEEASSTEEIVVPEN